MSKRLNQYALITIVLLLTLVGGAKTYSILTFPNISDWNYYQLQKIDHSKQNFSFAVFGDNKNSGVIFNRLLARLNTDNILFAIDDGDLVYGGDYPKFGLFLNQISHLNKPLLTVFGNHEAREQGRASYYELFGPFYYAFHVGKAFFIILDDANEEGLDEAQLAWLKENLKASQRYENRFVFMHVPLYDPRKGSYTQGHSLKNLASAKMLNRLLDANHVTMLFTSHIHGYFRGVWGKTPYTITGGGGADLAGSDPQHYFYHYIKVTISGSKVTYKVVKINKPTLILVSNNIHDGWVSVYAFFATHFIAMLLTILIASTIYLLCYFILTKKYQW